MKIEINYWLSLNNVLWMFFKSLAVYFYSVFLQSLDVCIAAQSTIWNHQYYVQYFVLLRISTFKKIDSRRLGALHLFLLEIRENLSVILDYFFTLFESAVLKFTRMFFPIYKSKSNSKLFKYEYNIYDNVQKIFLWEQFWTYHHKIRISGKNSISTICYKNDR